VSAQQVTGGTGRDKLRHTVVGRQIAHYRVLEPLGRGGMGEVFRALDTRLDRVVALKVLRPESAADPDRTKRLVREAKAASALNHPNGALPVGHGTARRPGGMRGADGP
jgi:serine/threonine protein kinase